jgi:predicted oxidoreductase
MSEAADVIIVGGGIAGIVAALELLDGGKTVCLVERNAPEAFGGAARWAFGGIFIVNSPLQRSIGIKDTPALAFADWCATAEFGPHDSLPRRWAEKYVYGCHEDVYRWLTQQSVRFLWPVIWAERGLYHPGNSYPRFHLVRGTGRRLVDILSHRLLAHPRRRNLQILFHKRVKDLLVDHGQVAGCLVRDEQTGAEAELRSGNVIVASGGMMGNLECVRANWHKPWGEPPEILLNGSHGSADGSMHTVVEAHGGNISHLDRMWNYASGVHHPFPRHALHGLSLLAPRNALWVNFEGRRVVSPPLITGFDMRYLVERICREEHKYSWQILNYRTAVWELGLLGAEFNETLQEPTWFKLLLLKLRGNRQVVNFLIRNCPDFVVATTVEDLVTKMNALNGDDRVKLDLLQSEIAAFDRAAGHARVFQNDDQFRRIQHLRKYPEERLRTRKPSKIVDPRGLPLLAVREFIITRKSLGGIQTDLACRVLQADGTPIPRLFAIGEAAGFGGGGIHGLRALEGTFLGGCILTARVAAKAIADGTG